MRSFFNLEKFLNKNSSENVWHICGINISFLAYFLSQHVKSFEKFIVIFPEENQTEEFISAFQIFSKDKAVIYPEINQPPFSEIYTLSMEEIERINILWNLKNIKVLAGSAVSFIRKNIPLQVLKNAYLYLIVGEKIDRERFLKSLINLGYERTGVVKEKGTFTVKGGIIDIWSPNYAYPVRMDFFGDEITAFKFFNPETQKSFENLEEISILPCKEVFFPENIEYIYKNFLKFKNTIPEKRLTEILYQIENRSITENSEYFLPLFYDQLDSILNMLSQKQNLILLYEPEQIERCLEKYWDKIYINALRAKEKYKFFFNENFIYLSINDFKKITYSFSNKVLIREIPSITGSTNNYIDFSVSKKFLEIPPGINKIDHAFNILKKSLIEGEKVILVVSDKKTEKVIEEGLRFRGVENFNNLEFKYGNLKEGFYLPDLFLWITSEYELFGKMAFQKKISKEGLKKAKSHFRKFEDLKPGDFVVHKIHGIGKYMGLTILNINGLKGEFLEIEYDKGDKLFLPVARLDELYPYVGITDKAPKLDKLGKKTFINRRKKIEKELREVVQELLALYAERKTIKSYSLSFPALAYEEFAATFPYNETPDQKIAIDEIINDLCSDKPMERLLVGDVGFGKTEVALRAIFITAYSGKQVAFLVPTTILAEQHFRNFKSRLEPFGIKVGILSRLRSKKEQKEVLKKISEGEIKVIIGTHRLLSSNIEFKDLGLLVIDEEHKFGVKQKEKIKQLKKNIKVLSLSATPIPRSLQLSLLGIFDLSVIEAPPPGRKPIKTILAKFEPEIIKYAIENELQRNGQVFFVNPRIQGLASLARYIKNLIPRARIEIIHGQMPGDLIEKNLYKFLNKQVDVLVCTPIIGSGIDIPSVNTIIINRADMFGLADIYQLRGRVGRAEEKAYAYLLVPSLKAISEEAQKRFKALLKFSELGSGFKLALSDLKIRGAGELLGIKQSGHINAVGYELYLELLENTIKALKGEEIEDWEPEINIKIPAYIPQNYIPEPEERLSIYRELVLIRNEKDLLDLKNFLRDKYGKIPQLVENLIKIYLLKLYMKKIKLTLVETKGKDLIFLLKDNKLLPKFRKIQSKFYIKKAEKFNKIVFKSKENPLDLALDICQKLLT